MRPPVADHIVRHGLVENNQWLTALGGFSFNERFVANHENIDLPHDDRQQTVQSVKFFGHGGCARLRKWESVIIPFQIENRPATVSSRVKNGLDVRILRWILISEQVHIDEASEPGCINLIKLLFLNRFQELIVIDTKRFLGKCGCCCVQ